jgi:hypothetical protein
MEDEDNSCRTIRRAQGQLERRNESRALTRNADDTLACILLTWSGFVRGQIHEWRDCDPQLALLRSRAVNHPEMRMQTSQR